MCKIDLQRYFVYCIQIKTKTIELHEYCTFLCLHCLSVENKGCD